MYAFLQKLHHALQQSYARGMVMAYFMAQLMPWATDQVGKLCCHKRITVIVLSVLQSQKITQKFMECHGRCACVAKPAHKNRTCMIQRCASTLMLGR